MMVEKVETKIARAEMFADQVWMSEHPQITLAYLRHAPVNTSLEHLARDDCRLQGLHRLVSQDPRLPVETDVRDVRDLDACFFQTILHRIVRKAAVVLPARKALLFGSGDNLAVLDKRGG